jgi:hypothetical protein
MNQRSIFDHPTAPPLRVVLAELAAGRLQIPIFQRGFEWRDHQRLGLFDSLARGLPIGSVIVWHTYNHKITCFEEINGLKLKLPPDGGVRRYLLDGHQRLATLFGALNYEGERGDAPRLPTIYFDARAPTNENAFVLHRKAKKSSEQKPRPGHWIELSALMHPRLRWEHVDRLRKEGDEESARRIAELALLLSDYPLPTIPLLSEDLDLVTQSFVRINSGGTQLKEHHLVNALQLMKFKLEEHLSALLQSLAALGWGSLDEQVIFDALKLSLDLDVSRADPSAFLTQSPKRLDEALLAQRFFELEAAFVSAVKMLNKHFIAGPKALPHPHQLLAIVEAYRRPLGVQDERAVIGWLWWTTYHSTFEQLDPSDLQEAIDRLCAIAATQSKLSPNTVDLSIRRDNTLARLRAIKLFLAHGNNKQSQELGKSGDSAMYLAHPELTKLKLQSVFAYVVCPPNELDKLYKAIEDPEGLIESNRSEEPDISEEPEDSEDAEQVDASRADDSVESNEELLEQYMIPVEAARALMEGDAAKFEELRREYMLAQERVFVEALGLTPSDEG